MGQECSTALIMRKETVEKFLAPLDDDDKDFLAKIEKNTAESLKNNDKPDPFQGVKVEREGLVMWFHMNDYNGDGLYNNQPMMNALEENADEEDWCAICVYTDIFPNCYFPEIKGELIDEAIEVFALSLNQGVFYNNDETETVFFSEENLRKKDGDMFYALFLTGNGFDEISEKESVTQTIDKYAFEHQKNDEGSHMFLFMNYPGPSTTEGKEFLEAVRNLDEDDYQEVWFTQVGHSSLTDDFQSIIDEPDVYGDAEICGDFDFHLAATLNYDTPAMLENGDNPDETGQQEKGLKNRALDVFDKMKDFPSKYGFHFSYSPESSWEGNADFLIMTINPSASDGHGKTKKIVPNSPWPKRNDFFDPKNSFPIKKPVQGVCYELSLRVNGDQEGDPLETAEKFANERAILASFVPFRTKDVGKIEDDMFDFAKNEYWGKIFDVWQPKTIVTFGTPPFTAMREFLEGKYKQMEYNEEKVSENGNLAYRMVGFRKPDGKTITLIGLPHPTAFGEKGFPTNFPENASENCRLREFFAQNLVAGVC